MTKQSSSDLFTRLGISEAEIMRQSQGHALDMLLPDMSGVLKGRTDIIDIDKAEDNMRRLHKMLKRKVNRKPK